MSHPAHSGKVGKIHILVFPNGVYVTPSESPYIRVYNLWIGEGMKVFWVDKHWYLISFPYCIFITTDYWAEWVVILKKIKIPVKINISVYIYNSWAIWRFLILFALSIYQLNQISIRNHIKFKFVDKDNVGIL